MLRAAPQASSTLNFRLWTWWTILRICIEERLVYRADFALGTLMRFLPIVTQIFLWGAIFEAHAGQEQLARGTATRTLSPITC